ncbi:MAG TPA: glycosyltransferase family A protein [Gemmatimonadaceae bacterium]|jgi:hypothetical protein
MPPAPIWTITALTIPDRERYLRELLRSLQEMPGAERAEIVIIYNHDARGDRHAIETHITRYSPRVPISVVFNGHDPTIAGGRAMQLGVCKTPLICFVDDDTTVHGDLLGTLESAMRTVPLGLVGVPSLVEDTDVRFKPRDETPSVTADGVRYMPVQGMLAASYTNLLRQAGGFNPRRRFWGEWTELNTRLWRLGYPTGFVMDGAFLRHWESAPSSPTRNMCGRERHVVWGLLCTAMEYDAVDLNEATSTFWRLVEERYLAYSYGDELSYRNLMRTTLELMPLLGDEWGRIQEFRATTRGHPFAFKPFHRFTEADVRDVKHKAERDIRQFRSQAGWGRPSLADRPGVRGIARRLHQTAATLRRWARVPTA